MRKQNGLSLVSLVSICILLGIALLLVLKLIPVYNEYFSVKAALNSIVNEDAGAPLTQIRESFAKHANIANISSVKPDDLDITQDKSGTTIAVTYQAKVPLVANVSLLFDFAVEAHHGEAAQ